MRIFLLSFLAWMVALSPAAAQTIASPQERAQATGNTSSTAPLAQQSEEVEDGRAIVRVSEQRAVDYEENRESEMFGAQLFTGAFSGGGAADFNPDYAINVGDTVNVRLFGGYNYQAALTVDAQGNNVHTLAPARWRERIAKGEVEPA